MKVGSAVIDRLVNIYVSIWAIVEPYVFTIAMKETIGEEVESQT